MKHRLALLALAGLLALGGATPAPAAPLAAVAAPVLKWQYGGCAAPPLLCRWRQRQYPNRDSVAGCPQG